MIYPLLVFSDWGILILRIVLGAIVFGFGWAEWKAVKAIQKDVDVPKKIEPLNIVIALLDTLSAAALIFGFFTQIFAFIIVLRFLISAFKNIFKTSVSFDRRLVTLIIVSALVLVFLSAGRFSIDAIFGSIVY